jgi:hypothetical protein
MNSYSLLQRVRNVASLLACVLVLAGCSTTPKVDWNSRVGSYTYDQAIVELGPPDKQARLSDGQTVAEWILRRSGGSGLTVGTGFYGGGAGVGVSQSVGSGYSDRSLKLTFDTDGRLSNWSKNY